ncbi:hypothetical protein CDAR_14211 [Caerostris darwini]|uniref:Uncharacterized protein n=1 Tax=Caerostris darwini TaxID=1538125 RepID=A0AAV4QI08_9ARAC|nr:hypothetical protein CDAR_14211 [Caerostris darwini]
MSSTISSDISNELKLDLALRSSKPLSSVISIMIEQRDKETPACTAIVVSYEKWVYFVEIVRVSESGNMVGLFRTSLLFLSKCAEVVFNVTLHFTLHSFMISRNVFNELKLDLAVRNSKPFGDPINGREY